MRGRVIPPTRERLRVFRAIAARRGRAKVDASMSRRVAAGPALLGACVLGLLALSGCPDDELVCVEVDLSCAPLYPPTWENVVQTTLVPKCGTGNGVCHSATGHRGGLVLSDPSTAHANLLNGGYLVPGDVSCSELTQRIFSTSSSLVMPRGAPLPPAERCSIAQWVAAGAPGPATTPDAGVSP